MTATTTPRIASPHLTPEEAAEYLSIGNSTMKKWRLAGEGPRYAKFGKSVRYRVEDLDAWIEENLVG